MRVLVCGGGTGGHIYPALAAVAELRQHGLAANQFLWIGTRGEMEERLVPRAGLDLETIQAGAVVGVPPWEMMKNAAKLTWSLGKSYRLFGKFRPNVVFMTGGYVNVPVALVARMRQVPAAIYLPDIEPGAAIRFLSRFVEKIACTASASRAYFSAEKVAVTGYPVRPEIRAATELSREAALARFDLGPSRPTLFVFGGSRGARSLNRALTAILPTLLTEIQVIHITGQLDWPEVEAESRRLPVGQQAYYRPYPYLHERMGAAFRAADLVVARAGASMLGEAPAFGLPAVLVPYPHAWRYQRVNADYLADRGAALRMDDELLEEDLLPTVLTLLRDETRLARMAEAARALDTPGAARNVANLLLQLGQEGRSGKGL